MDFKGEAGLRSLLGALGLQTDGAFDPALGFSFVISYIVSPDLGGGPQPIKVMSSIP